MFEWDDLRYFLTVARATSTAAAAKILGVNQSTVQRRLALLEQRIGHKLIDRNPTGSQLTEIGKELLPYAEDVEQSVTTFGRRLASIGHSLTGVVRVTCPDGLVTALMTPMINDFHKRHPGVRIDLIVSERFLDLTKGEADIAVRGGVPGSDALFGRKIAESPWAVYASRAYIEKHGRPETPEDINRHAIVDFDSGNAHIHHLSTWLRNVAPQAKVTARSETVIGLMMAVKSGAGLTILPMPMADAQPDLVRVLEPLPELFSPIYLLVHPDLRSTPRVRAFFDFVVAEIDAYRPVLLGQTKPLT